MKKYSVYKLVNGHGKVEYVGRTTMPVKRLYQHTKVKSSPGNGMFYGRTDITMEIVKIFDNVKEANLFEGKLKLSYGFEWTENESRRLTLSKLTFEQRSAAGKAGGKSPSYQQRKLDYQTAEYIRAQYARKVDGDGKKITLIGLCKIFNVSHETIRNILNNKTYTQA